MVISTGVAGIGIALIGLCVFSGLCAARSLAGRHRAAGPGGWPLALAAAGAGMLALGCRLCVAQGLVSWAPYLDQWNAEFSGVVAPLAHGDLSWRNLVAGNNEHRVLLTRALSLAVILLNGSWDNRVMVVANYLLESFLVAWVFALAWKFLGWARGACVGAAALLPMLLVCGWESIVSSNQTQFIFMAFGSVVALSLVQGYSLRSPGSLGALAIALLTLGSMVSGFLTALAMMAMAVIAAYTRRVGWRQAAAFCAACLAIAALGWLTRVEFTALYSVYAASFAGWLEAFLAYASWPLPRNLLGFLCLWLPWLVLLARTLRRRELEPFAPFALGLGLWVLLQSCALAWARAGLSGLVSSRYTEFLGWGFVANAAALVLLLAGPGPKGGRRMAAWTAVAVWLAGVGGFEVWRSQADYRPYLDAFRDQTLEHEQRLGEFMRTGEAGVIEGVGFPRIPYIYPGVILSLLGDPQVQPFLPGPLRRDLVRDREPSLLPSVHDGPLCFVAVRVLRSGRWFAAAGIAMLFAAFLLARRTFSGSRPDTARTLRQV
jgi:hypothetical protein